MGEAGDVAAAPASAAAGKQNNLRKEKKMITASSLWCLFVFSSRCWRTSSSSSRSSSSPLFFVVHVVIKDGNCLDLKRDELLSSTRKLLRHYCVCICTGHAGVYAGARTVDMLFLRPLLSDMMRATTRYTRRPYNNLCSSEL